MTQMLPWQHSRPHNHLSHKTIWSSDILKHATPSRRCQHSLDNTIDSTTSCCIKPTEDLKYQTMQHYQPWHNAAIATQLTSQSLVVHTQLGIPHTETAEDCHDGSTYTATATPQSSQPPVVCNQPEIWHTETCTTVMTRMHNFNLECDQINKTKQWKQKLQELTHRETCLISWSVCQSIQISKLIKLKLSTDSYCWLNTPMMSNSFKTIWLIA